MNWRLYAAGIVLALLVSGILYVRHLQQSRVKAEAVASAAKAQTVVDQATVQAIDRVTITERRISNEVRYITKQIDALPSGEALVPADVAGVWADGIDRMRQPPTKPRGDDTAGAEGLPADATP